MVGLAAAVEAEVLGHPLHHRGNEPTDIHGLRQPAFAPGLCEGGGAGEGCDLLEPGAAELWIDKDLTFKLFGISETFLHGQLDASKCLKPEICSEIRYCTTLGHVRATH